MLDTRLSEIVDGLEDQGRTDPDEPLPAPQTALRELLERVLEADGLLAGVIWMLDDQGQLRVMCEVGMHTLAPDGRFVIGAEHQQQLTGVLREGQVVCRQMSVTDQAEESVMTVAIGPLLRQSEVVGTLELFTDPELPEPQARLLVHSLSRLCEMCGRLLNRGRAPQQKVQEDSDFWARIDQFTLNLQRSLDVTEVATIAVNDARVLLGCDRVSLALKHGPQTRIQAVSGQEQVQSRANLIRGMNSLAEAAIASGEVITYSGSVEGFAPQVEEPLAEFLVESHARMVMLVPLRKNASPGTSGESSHASTRQPGPVIACLVLEQSTDTQPRPALVRRIDLVGDHVAAALTNARQHSELFLLPLWRTLGRGAGWFQGRRRWIAFAILMGLSLIGAGLAIIPWDYQVEARGRAMPVIRRDVFAPWDGEVVEVFVSSGDPVHVGEQLARIESDELDEEYIVARNAVHELREQSSSLRLQFQEAIGEADRLEQRRLGGELMAARIQLRAAEEHELNLAKRIERLTIVAAIDGVVVTYQLSQNLKDRPVNRGELMMQVMDDTGPWRLELEVPDDRIGHVLRAADTSETGQLSIGYVPATAVELTLDGTIERDAIATRSNQSMEAGTIVEVFADIDPNDLPQRHIGADVTARVDCGKRSLGYVLFGDVIEFVQRELWW